MQTSCEPLNLVILYVHLISKGSGKRAFFSCAVETRRDLLVIDLRQTRKYIDLTLNSTTPCGLCACEYVLCAGELYCVLLGPLCSVGPYIKVDKRRPSAGHCLCQTLVLLRPHTHVHTHTQTFTQVQSAREGISLKHTINFSKTTWNLQRTSLNPSSSSAAFTFSWFMHYHELLH